jgi:N-acetyl-1-D-myo-inositol-2-amino-2-deoxy-alpha-D-glucopyranoside deacetylase
MEILSFGFRLLTGKSVKMLGSHVFSGILVVPSGLFLGLMSVIYHSSYAPLGLGLVTLATGSFFWGLRLANAKRLTLIFGILSYFGAVVVLAGLDGQGSVLIAGNTAGLVFLGSATLVALIVLAWPKLPPRASRYDGESSSIERTSRP